MCTYALPSQIEGKVVYILNHEVQKSAFPLSGSLHKAFHKAAEEDESRNIITVNLTVCSRPHWEPWNVNRLIGCEFLSEHTDVGQQCQFVSLQSRWSVESEMKIWCLSGSHEAACCYNCPNVTLLPCAKH